MVQDAETGTPPSTGGAVGGAAAWAHLLLDAVGSAGNAAGTGAAIALLNTATRAEIEATVRDIEKIETAVEPRFQEYFVEAMAIPNRSDPFTRLFSVVPRPAGADAAAKSDAGRSRRRRRRTS